ncbi:hypothetical protein BSKO_06036 [Bryopsis sp. KO-2023]|nr:hypothetical protein BSKO_06036 [Bryopsis sp. KO-2023]
MSEELGNLESVALGGTDEGNSNSEFSPNEENQPLVGKIEGEEEDGGNMVSVDTPFTGEGVENTALEVQDRGKQDAEKICEEPGDQMTSGDGEIPATDNSPRQDACRVASDSFEINEEPDSSDVQSALTDYDSSEGQAPDFDTDPAGSNAFSRPPSILRKAPPCTDLGTIGEDDVLPSSTPVRVVGGMQDRALEHDFSTVKYGMPDASMDLGSLDIFTDGLPEGHKIMSEHMAKLVAYTSKMDMLRLSNCNSVNDQVLTVLRPLTCLTFLDVSRCDYITDAGMECLACFSSLTHLDINRSMGISDEGLVHLSGLTELTYLDIGRRQKLGWLSKMGMPEQGTAKNKRITDAGVEHLTTLQKLEWLGLGHCAISMSGLDTLAGFPVLERLDLGGCDITDSGLNALQNIPKLKFLSLRRCDSIRDDGLMVLGELTNLVGLDLGGCSLITEEGVQYLCMLQQLKTLDLASCRKIASSGLEHVGYLYALHHLDLSGMNELFGYGMASLAELSQLWWLNLSGNKDLTDDGAKHLQHLKRLKLLGLAGCVKLTFEGLMGFLPELTKLKFIDLSKLPRISRSKLVPLQKQYTFVKLQQI